MMFQNRILADVSGGGAVEGEEDGGGAPVAAAVAEWGIWRVRRR
jgi:hypothetical protein